LRIDIVTLFPEVFEGILRESIIGRAIRRELVDIRTVNLRDFTHDSRKTVDDRPYGGGPGMLMKPEPLFEAVESLRQPDSTVILTSPQGRVFDQSLARCLASRNHLILL
jgi:tRNA (guanine37-N1)-methyltransferase